MNIPEAGKVIMCDYEKSEIKWIFPKADELLRRFLEITNDPKVNYLNEPAKLLALQKEIKDYLKSVDDLDINPLKLSLFPNLPRSIYK